MREMHNYQKYHLTNLENTSRLVDSPGFDLNHFVMRVVASMNDHLENTSRLVDQR